MLNMMILLLELEFIWARIQVGGIPVEVIRINLFILLLLLVRNISLIILVLFDINMNLILRSMSTASPRKEKLLPANAWLWNI